MLLDGGLDERVLVVGVTHQHLDDCVDVVCDLDPAGSGCGVDVAGLERDGEELGPDGLVDVPVQIDGRHFGSLDR